jgi:hypothetical protein
MVSNIINTIFKAFVVYVLGVILASNLLPPYIGFRATTFYHPLILAGAVLLIGIIWPHRPALGKRIKQTLLLISLGLLISMIVVMIQHPFEYIPYYSGLLEFSYERVWGEWYDAYAWLPIVKITGWWILATNVIQFKQFKDKWNVYFLITVILYVAILYYQLEFLREPEFHG